MHGHAGFWPCTPAETQHVRISRMTRTASYISPNHIGNSLWSSLVLYLSMGSPARPARPNPAQKWPGPSDKNMLSGRAWAANIGPTADSGQAWAKDLHVFWRPSPTARQSDYFLAWRVGPMLRKAARRLDQVWATNFPVGLFTGSARPGPAQNYAQVYFLHSLSFLKNSKTMFYSFKKFWKQF
jgi:hypothetical protein